MMQKTTFILMSLLLIMGLGNPTHAQQQPIGDWEGKLMIGGSQSLRIVFHITEEGGQLKSTMDSPDQGAFGIPASETTFEAPNLSIKIDQILVHFTGKYLPESQSIEGNFKQGNIQSFPLNLSAEVKKVERPQTPKAPFPYKSEDIRFENKVDKISLAGTLTLPKGEGPFTAVILISGSGPQDRDETIFEHKPFWVIADAFSRNGIAVLRFDDRGVGESEGERSLATSEDFARDVLAGVAYLKGRKEVDQQNIGLIGHSEGGLIAPLVAREEEAISFLIMLAGQGTSGTQVMKDQNGAILEKSGLPNKLVNKYKNYLGKAYQLILETPADKVEAELRKQSATLISGFEASEKAQLGLGEEAVVKLGNALNQPWWRFFLAADPTVYMKDLDIPVLALFGGNDIQVLAEPNERGLKEIFDGKAGFSSKIYPKKNHLFQNAQTGMVSEYGQLTETFAEEVIQDMVDWIKER